MLTVFCAWLYGRFIEIRASARERNFKDRIKAAIFLETQSNLKEKVNPSILKDYFSSRTDPFIFTLAAPMLVYRSEKFLSLHAARFSSVPSFS